MKLELKNSIRILKIGGWACLQQVARPITGMLMFSLVYVVGGREGTAAFGIGGQLFNYTFIFLVGLSTAFHKFDDEVLGLYFTTVKSGNNRNEIRRATIIEALKIERNDQLEFVVTQSPKTDAGIMEKIGFVQSH